ncbi:MAG: septation protein SepH [Nocardioides sp.]|nr:septation protein SepH [Nocardioides sp.]
MQQLSVVGLSKDGTRLVLLGDSGDEYAVPVDARLRAALRGDHTRLGQLEISMESVLRPRDIQARIRAGETPEAVAQAAQTTVDRIMAFAQPVLAERAHVADRAQRSSVRRRAESAAGPRTLGDAVAETLRARNVDPTTVEWDSWRREDGRWRLVAEYSLDGRDQQGTFSYDLPGQYVVAEDDGARTLLGDEPEKPVAPPPSAAPRAGARRLSAVADSPDSPLPLGDDAIALVADDEAPRTDDTAEGRAHDQDHDQDREQTVDLTDAAEVVRDTEPEEAPETRAPAAEQTTEPQADEPSEQSVEQPPEQPAKSRKARRSSVPSWDEIMFGGGRRE